MIIWIASYPKSGNTWIRSLLSSYLYSDNGVFNFDLLEKIQQFPSKQYFEPFTKDFTNIKKISDYWIAAQDRIRIFNKEPIFLKTHSALCTFENNPFTNKENTSAVIYIVRDPRNLITSFSHHYSLGIDESFDYMKDKNQMLLKNNYGQGDFGIATVVGDWATHYQSWKNIKFAPILIIKYEDIIINEHKVFLSILNFLSKFIKITLDTEKIENVLTTTTFNNLSKMEDQDGFDEAITSETTKEKVKFFNLGKKNDWKNLLDPKMEKKITTTFYKDMKDLGYI